MRPTASVRVDAMVGADVVLPLRVQAKELEAVRGVLFGRSSVERVPIASRRA